jgi:hypothetical protein
MLNYVAVRNAWYLWTVSVVHTDAINSSLVARSAAMCASRSTIFRDWGSLRACSRTSVVSSELSVPLAEDEYDSE